MDASKSMQKLLTVSLRFISHSDAILSHALGFWYHSSPKAVQGAFRKLER